MTTHKFDPTRKLYLAYGSNLKVKEMKWRAPDAKPLGTLMLADVQLVFRGVADLEWKPGAQAPVGIWEISEKDEEKLDRYEGVGHGFYTKFMVKLKKPKFGRKAGLIYLMTDRDGIYPPSAFYAATIRDGYRNFQLPQSYLDDAIERSFNDKNPSEQTINRRKRQRNSSHQKRLVKMPVSVMVAREKASRKLAEERLAAERAVIISDTDPEVANAQAEKAEKEANGTLQLQ